MWEQRVAYTRTEIVPVDECEIKVIKETFKDLCHVNGGSMRIDKETFLQYLPLPGLLGERLFAVFDKKSSGEIDYEEFVCGLAVTCRGSWEEKVEFIFNLYDIHGQGAVNRDELAALLNHVPKSIMRFGRAVALDATAAEERARGSALRPRAEGREPPPAGVAPESVGGEGAAAGAVVGAAAHATELKAGSAGGEGESSGRSRRGTARSDSSTEGGASFAAAQHHPHWEIFTNNDIVDQAFEECDLNQTGKLSFPEFRLWVERNPIVTQFLQSVFPYDEHREWGDDRKHLPFIHNRDKFTASPMRSEPSVGGGAGGGDPESPEHETRRLLVKARNTTRNEALRESIDRLIEQVAGSAVGGGGLPAVASMGSMNGTASPDAHSQHGDGPPVNSGRKGVTGNAPSVLLSELSPRSAKVMQNQTVAKQGFLWKQGYRLKTWYVLVGNCIYYYHHEADVYPSKVMFLTGSFVEPLQEVANERKGYWGIEISRNREQDDFEIGEELGKGRFSRVCMCVNKHTLDRNAVKIIMKEDMKQDEKDLLRAEIAIMRLVNHPNIIRMEAVYESKKDIFIVMQLHSGGELFDRIVGRPRFTEDEAFTVMYPLVESVAYLHEMGIVHRDLKPENILCGDRIEDIKIADFGLSKMVMPDEIMKMPCGTLTYVAPEVLTLNGYGKEADIWSVGTIMYLLLRGRLPFDGETREEIIENTIHGAIAWQNDPVWANFSEDGKDLVLGMLNKDREKRYTAKAILAHPWITQRECRREEHPELFEFDF
ncbi:n/a [Ectocarpus siliculosus]|uniref:N/a n=1 Tax=Ectocarpus siliculosus TaxID=2880 RepID=D8LIC5_ECTSI|nr:n/a [Ectocarpus siliculosus]|eukprot:CBN79428.1 n/a [Ectocarpus siliculosus]